MSGDNKIIVGEIVGTSGIKGYVRIKTYTQDTSDIAHFSPLLDSTGNIYNISRLVSTKGSVAVVQIKGVDSPEIASTLIGKELMVEQSLLPQADEGEFYYAELIGCDVFYEDETKYGTIVDVVNYGASDIIEVEESESSKTTMYPFIDEYVVSVDLDGKKVVVKRLEHL